MILYRFTSKRSANNANNFRYVNSNGNADNNNNANNSNGVALGSHQSPAKVRFIAEISAMRWKEM